MERLEVGTGEEVMLPLSLLSLSSSPGGGGGGDIGDVPLRPTTLMQMTASSWLDTPYSDDHVPVEHSNAAKFAKMEGLMSSPVLLA